MMDSVLLAAIQIPSSVVPVKKWNWFPLFDRRNGVCNVLDMENSKGMDMMYSKLY